MEILLVWFSGAVLGAALGFGVGFYLASKWAGEAMGRSAKREMAAGRITESQMRALIDGLKAK